MATTTFDDPLPVVRESLDTLAALFITASQTGSEEDLEALAGALQARLEEFQHMPSDVQDDLVPALEEIADLFILHFDKALSTENGAINLNILPVAASTLILAASYRDIDHKAGIFDKILNQLLPAMIRARDFEGAQGVLEFVALEPAADDTSTQQAAGISRILDTAVPALIGARYYTAAWNALYFAFHHGKDGQPSLAIDAMLTKMAPAQMRAKKYQEAYYTLDFVFREAADEKQKLAALNVIMEDLVPVLTQPDPHLTFDRDIVAVFLARPEVQIALFASGDSASEVIEKFAAATAESQRIKASPAVDTQPPAEPSSENVAALVAGFLEKVRAAKAQSRG